MSVSLNSADGERAALSAALGSQYELGGVIGRGGMGRVYHAREPFLDRELGREGAPRGAG